MRDDRWLLCSTRRIKIVEMTLVRLFVFFGGVIVLTLFGLLIGPYFVDWSTYKANFERQASQIIGQKVVVKGDAELSLLPFPSLTFTNLEIGESQNGLPLMVVDQFEMDLEISPLLSGEILVFDMRIDRPIMSVTMFEDGSFDWVNGQRSDLGGNELVLENVTITNGEIILLDIKNQRTERIDNIQASLSAPEIVGPWHIDGTASVRDMPLGFNFSTGAARDDGKMRLRGRLTSDPYPMVLELEGDIDVAESKPSYEGNFSIQKLNDKNVLNTPAHLRPLLTMQIKGGFDLSNEKLLLPNYRFLSGNVNDPYIIKGHAGLILGQTPKFDIMAKGQQVDVARLSEQSRPADRVNSTQTAMGFAQLAALLNRIPIPNMPGQIDLSIPALITGDTTVRELKIQAAPIQDGWQLTKASAKLPGRTNVEASGDLNLSNGPSFEGNLLVASQQPSGFSSWLIGRVDPQIRQMGVAGLSANVVLNNRRQSFDNMELILGSTEIKGKAERQVQKDGSTETSMALEGPELDIDRVLALLSLINEGENIADGGQMFAQNITANITTDLLKYGTLSAKGIEAELKWDNGHINLSNLTFADFIGVNGQLSGEIRDLGRTPVGTLEFSIHGESAEQLVAFVQNINDESPIIRQLSANPEAYKDFALRGAFKVDRNQLPRVTSKGTINDSAFSFEGNGQALMPFAFETISEPLDIKILADNVDGAVLLSQMGLQTLPLSFDTPGNIALNIARGFDPNFNISSYLSIGNTEIDLIGYIDTQKDQSLENATGEFDVAMKSQDIEPLFYMLGQSLPGSGSGLPIEIVGKVSANKNEINLREISGTSSENAFTGEIVIDRHASHLNLAGRLAMTKLDFDWLYELTLGVPILDFPDLNATDLTASHWSTSSFLPPFNSAPRASIALSSDRFYVASLDPIEGFSGAILTEPGQLDIKNIKGQWYDGKLRADVQISNPDGNAFSRLTGDLTGANIAKITSMNLTETTKQPKFQGQIDIQANLEGAGNSLSEMVTSANGGGTFKFNELQITDFQPDIFDKMLRAVDQDEFEITNETVNILAEQLIADGDFYLETLNIPFAITGGVQRIANMNIKAGNPSLNGEARFDLVEQSISASLDMIYDPGLEAQQGASSELTYSFNGPYDAPDGQIEVSAMSNFLAIRAYERERRQVELLQASILEKQRLRREIALVKDQQLKREEQARLKAEEEARLKAEEEARLQAELEARLDAEAEAQRIANEALQRALETKRTAEEEARRLAEEAIERARQAALKEQALQNAFEKLKITQEIKSNDNDNFVPAEEPSQVITSESGSATLTDTIENFLDQNDQNGSSNDIQVIELDAPAAE